MPFYAFFPAFPAFIRGVGYVVGDWWAGSALVSIIVGLAWVPVFQKLAERYLSERDAFESTVLAAAFPYVLIFTTVAYTEGLFTLATASAWYLYLKGKHVTARVLVALAALTRPYGILILLPMLVKVRRTASRIVVDFQLRIPYFIPVAALAAWVAYLRLQTGSWFIILESEMQWIGRGREQTLWFWLSQVPTLHPISPIPVAELSRILIFAFVFILMSGLINSLFRLASFIFPTWLVLRIGSRVGMVFVGSLFLVASVLFRFLFLMGYFIG